MSRLSDQARNVRYRQAQQNPPPVLNVKKIKEMIDDKNSWDLIESGIVFADVHWVNARVLEKPLTLVNKRFHPYMIAHSYLKKLAETQIPVRNQNRTIQLDENTGRFGDILFDQDMEKIQKKLYNIKKKKMLHNHKVLTGVPFVKTGEISVSNIKKLLELGAVLIGNEECRDVRQGNEDLQAANSAAALVANKCICFAVHRVRCDRPRLDACYYRLWTCSIVSSNDIMITASNFRDLKTIALNFWGVDDAPLRDYILPKEPIVVSFGYSNYVEDQELYRIAVALSIKTIFMFKSNYITNRDAARIMASADAYTKLENKHEYEENTLARPLDYVANRPWSYALSALNKMHPPLEPCRPPFLHSITMPVGQQLYIQVTCRSSADDSCINFFQFVDKIDDFNLKIR